VRLQRVNHAKQTKKYLYLLQTSYFDVSVSSLTTEIPSTWLGNIRIAFGLLFFILVEGAIAYCPRIRSHQLKYLLVHAILLCPFKKLMKIIK